MTRGSVTGALRLAALFGGSALLSCCIAATALMQPKPGQTLIDAERGFAVRAQRDGQWTAFRATADADALMFVPQPVKAQELLADLDAKQARRLAGRCTT